MTLQRMRNLLSEKQNLTLEQYADNNAVLTISDTNGNDLERTAAMLAERLDQVKNKVLRW